MNIQRGDGTEFQNNYTILADDAVCALFSCYAGSDLKEQEAAVLYSDSEYCGLSHVKI